MSRLPQFTTGVSRRSFSRSLLCTMLLAAGMTGIASAQDSGAAAAGGPAARVASRQPAPPPQAPFPPLSAEAEQQLHSVLAAWERNSSATKTLEAKFTRWHYDLNGVPAANVHSERADGVLKYAKPDRGLFRVDRLVFFAGMEKDQPVYREMPGQFGEHWVCTGKQLIEFDRSQKECKIRNLPPEMQGQQIIESPLPFVFNLDAAKIRERYWVRQVEAPEGVVLIEAWPKRQQDRSQYKLVQIALDASNYLPRGLRMYAPNFDPKQAPVWDHYEFAEVKQNSIGNKLADFMKNFIPEKPPASWKISNEQM